MRALKSKVILLLLLLIIFSAPAQAGQKPSDYDKPDKFLSGYFNALPTTEEKVYLALDLIETLHPSWKKSYKPHAFDCSEMSEYVKYFFIKCGIKATYCQSDALWHCWVEAKDEKCPGKKYLIECISLRVIPEESYEHYYGYKDVRYDRHMAVSEIDWWNSEF